MNLKLQAALCLIALLLTSWVIASPQSNPGQFDKLVVFGDSWSDFGNVYALTKGLVPPSFIYAKGAFSNGPLWDQYIEDLLGVEVKNYAYAGATSDSTFIQGRIGLNITVKVPGLVQQAELFANETKLVVNPEKTLAVCWLLGNDYGFTNFTAAPSEVVAHEVIAWTKLYQTGIRNFFLPQLPDLSISPYFKGSSNEFKNLVREISKNTNVALLDAITKFENDHLDIKVWSFDTYNFLNYVEHSVAPSLGVTNFTDPCINFVNLKLSVCPDPGKYFFFDPYHLETKQHKVLAEAFAKNLTGT